MGFGSWLKEASTAQPRERKRAPRHTDPGIIAYYWDGGEPVARDLKNISLTGAYLYTTDRWYPGTILRLTLQITSELRAGPDEGALTVSCKVTRHGADGLGVRFLLQNDAECKRVQRFVEDALKTRGSGAGQNSSTSGQALIEFALMLPLLLLLIFNLVNMGTFLYAFITVADAARAGAQYAVMGGASVGSPVTPGYAAIQTVVNADTSALPAPVSVCVNQNATALNATGSCSFGIAAIPADPEAPQYVSVAIDVNYNYTPFVSIPTFFGMPVTIPPTTIQRRVLMRLLQ